MTDLIIRPGTDDDIPAIVSADERGFSARMSELERADAFTVLPPENFLLAVDSGDPVDGVVGVAAAYDMAMTLPGGAALPSRGVAWVSVPATHRRRGILRALMAEQLRGFVEAGTPLAILTASHASIYGRFGYGEATRNRTVEIDPRFAQFRAGAPDPGGVRYAETAEIGEHAAEIHRRWVARTPGAVSRSAAWWARFLHDREYSRGGGTRRFHLVHPDGWVTYRSHWGGEAPTLRAEVFAVTDESHAALWRVLLAQELVRSVTARIPLDDPLPLLLTDPRIVATTEVADGLWARVLDVPTVLSARRYAVEVDTVLDVQDDFLGRGGRFRLQGGPDGATCTPTSDAAQVTLDVADLGSLVTGCVRARTLAAAARLAAEPAELARLDAAFVPERDPVHGTDF
ncbi:GNAT family N-acetyltransferase [Pseudonocardia sp. CA-107938]|uniref:GNAT family N-acetyltransferase n=1 Tax=Pseudonocardia sp. CA-107938 TaxID=3240021 RepID=UPI003D8AE09F